MNSKSYHVVRVTALSVAVATLIGITPVHAQVRSGAITSQSGNDSGGAIRTDSVLCDATANIARLTKSLDCSLLKKRTSCASATLEARPTGGRAFVKIAGRTVFTKSLKRSGTLKFDPIVIDIFRVPPFELFDIGIASIKLSGNAGAGAQFGSTYGISRKPVRADLNGAAHSWGNATGKLQVDILFGAVSGQVEAIVNFFNSTLGVDLHATTSGIQNSRATFTAILWELWIKLKAKVFGATVWSKTLVDGKGPSFTKTLFGPGA